MKSLFSAMAVCFLAIAPTMWGSVVDVTQPAGAAVTVGTVRYVECPTWLEWFCS